MGALPPSATSSLAGRNWSRAARAYDDALCESLKLIIGGQRLKAENIEKAEKPRKREKAENGKLNKQCEQAEKHNLITVEKKVKQAEQRKQVWNS